MVANLVDEAQPAIQIRRMEDKDVATVMAIELAAYEFPWTDGIFRDCIRVGYRCRVLEQGNGDMAGYGVMSVGAGEAHILNLCVRSAARGRGYGRTIMINFNDQTRRLGADTKFLEVRPSNHNTHKKFESLSFNDVGMRAGYY